jgi:3-hydroxymyristoyl/3-hydroxydecanoyl-(acyl carrier protein) dehydratase
MAAESPPKLLHRFPFVLFDRGAEDGTSASSSSRLVSIDDSLHEGRAGTTFGQVLLVEAMAQTAALFAEKEGRKKSGMLVGLSRIRFGRNPRPGDRLVVEASLVQKFGDLVRVAGRVSESGERLAEGEILISLAGGAEE